MKSGQAALDASSALNLLPQSEIVAASICHETAASGRFPLGGFREQPLDNGPSLGSHGTPRIRSIE